MDKEAFERYKIRDYYMIPVEIVDNMFYLFEQQCQKQKEVIDKAEKILNECKLLMTHEFDWEEQVDNALDILKEVSE